MRDEKINMIVIGVVLLGLLGLFCFSVYAFFGSNVLCKKTEDGVSPEYYLDKDEFDCCPIPRSFFQAQYELEMCHKQICEEKGLNWYRELTQKKDCIGLYNSDGKKPTIKPFLDKVICIDGVKEINHTFEMCDFIDLNVLNTVLKVEEDNSDLNIYESIGKGLFEKRDKNE